MNRASANLLLLITGAIWGAGFIAQATAMDSIGPVLFTGIRFLAAALAVLPFAVIEARRGGCRNLGLAALVDRSIAYRPVQKEDFRAFSLAEIPPDLLYKSFESSGLLKKLFAAKGVTMQGVGLLQ